MQITNEDIAGIPLTRGFPVSTKPAMVGRYRYEYRTNGRPELTFPFMCFWDGGKFFIDDGSPHDGDPVTIDDDDRWYGLARDPQAEGEYRKQHGMQRALNHAGDDWKDAAINKVREWCAGDRPGAMGGVFAFEDIRAWALAHGLPPPPDHHAWGAIAQVAANAGIFTFTGNYRPAVAPRTHHHPVRLYSVGIA